MNFISSFLSGPQMMMLNLNQRSANSNPSSLFNPSMQSSKGMEYKHYNENPLPSTLDSISDQKSCLRKQHPSMNISQANEVSLSQSEAVPKMNENIPQLPLMNTLLEDQTAQSMLLTSLIITHQQNLISQLLASPSNPLVLEIMQQHQQAIAAQQMNAQKSMNQTENISKNQMREISKSNEIERINENEDDFDDDNDERRDSINLRRKRIQKINICGHHDKEHYAKGMCSNCYHKFGRTKKPWLCGHEKLYARGLCQNCYINKYNQVRKQNTDQQGNSLADEQQLLQNKNLKIENDQSEELN